MKTLHHAGKRMASAFAPAKILQSRLHKKVMMDFAEKIGLVYFGYVNQRHDEHRLIRGLTVSARHYDDHYCIGTYQDYDVMLVERVDSLAFPGKKPKSYDWVIMAFDLHVAEDLPHIFVGLSAQNDAFYAHLFTKFPKLTPVPPGGMFDVDFSRRYTLYAEPAHAMTAQQLFDKEITKEIGEHFGSLTIEISEGCLYIYAEHQRPTQALLDKMIKCGVWLARSIDARN